MENKKVRVLVTGSTGLVGTAVLNSFINKGYENVFGTYHRTLPDFKTYDRVKFVKVDFTDQKETEKLFDEIRPLWVILSAAKVGGILANNTYKADFIYQNLAIALNIVHSSYKFGVKKLLNLGSSCIYPKFSPQPMKEEHLLTGVLEPTNEPYAIAKISAIKLCRYYNEQFGTNFFSLMPTNLYGPNDNFDLFNSHVLPALIRKFHLAKLLKAKNYELIKKDLEVFGNKPELDLNNSNIEEVLNNAGIFENKVVLWGTGEPYREFLYVSDLADAVLYTMENLNAEDIKKVSPDYFVNVGMGKDIKIKDLAELIKEIVGYDGNIIYDVSKPDGMSKKLLDVSKIHALGWQAKITLEEGVKKTYIWYLERIKKLSES